MPVGSTVTWTYVVTNTSARALSAVSVTDDQEGTVTCPQTTLEAGVSFTCTATGTAVAGQYTNIGTVTAMRTDASVVMDSDPSHYFGQAGPSVTLEKRTNGFDADTPPGVSVPVGSTVTWQYVVTNVGTENLIGIAVTDDRGVTVSCPGTTLPAGMSMTCTAAGMAQAGQYVNVGSVTATLETSATPAAASDPSHYFGQTLRLVKRTNGVDYASSPGPTLAPGSTVTWTYEVTNPGPATVTGVAVTDDQGVTVTCPQTTLASGGVVTCSGSGPAEPGPYTNTGTATATLPAGGVVTATDSSFYFGNLVGLVKSTNGADANTAPGPSLNAGDIVNWTYVVTNFGDETLVAVSVTDNQGVIVTCPDPTVAAGASMTCTASGLATAGQYANLGTVSATSPTYGGMTASDPSHYFGQATPLDFGDAPDPSHPSRFASDGARHVLGGSVFLGNCVDAELDAPAGAAADGDDSAAGTPFGNCTTPGDDEDGVTFTGTLRAGSTASVDVVASAPCTLSAWIDFAGDGDWADAGETLFPGGTALVAGTNPLTFSVPLNATPGATYARFRCTTAGPAAVTGSASDGEVEDYTVTVLPALPAVAASKTDALVADGDGDGFAEPGDTVRYTVVVTNNGLGEATSAVFTDSPGANTRLVSGSVTTTAGTVTSGNGAGDSSVGLDLGTIAATGSVTITFDLTIDNPLPAGVTTVSNQGTVSGGNFTSVPTDDPAQAGSADPTVTPIALAPIVTATKTAALQGDVDGDGLADGGDTLRYTIIITNNGPGDATAIVFQDTPDPNTVLINGLVTTTGGVVTSGNTPGDSSVTVTIPTIPALGGSVTITFDVRIDPTLPPGVTEVRNSGTISGADIPSFMTDDPSQPGANDVTVFAVASPAPIPTLETWALLALLLLGASIAMWRLAGT